MYYKIQCNTFNILCNVHCLNLATQSLKSILIFLSRRARLLFPAVGHHRDRRTDSTSSPLQSSKQRTEFSLQFFRPYIHQVSAVGE